jgi:chromosome segregation protein
VQQNVNLFERQAKKAEKWRELRDAARSLELSYQHDSYTHIAVELEILQLEHAKDENRAAELDARRATGEAELEEQKLALFGEEQQVAELSRKAAGTQAEAIRGESEGDRTRDRAGHLDESLRRLKAEAEEAARRLEEMGQQRTEALREAAEAEAFLSGAAERSRLAREAADAEGAKLQEARGAADALSGERMTALEEISGLRQRLGAAEAELQHLADSEGEWAGERDARVRRSRKATRDRTGSPCVRALRPNRSGFRSRTPGAVFRSPRRAGCSIRSSRPRRAPRAPAGGWPCARTSCPSTTAKTGPKAHPGAAR